MKKEMFDLYYRCNLYQADSSKGYLDRRVVSHKYSAVKGLEEVEGIQKIGTVIVRKNPFCKYQLREVLTGVPFDTLYEDANGLSPVGSSNHTLKGNKKEYHTFIVVPKYNASNIPTVYRERYEEEHRDVEAYQQQLLELIANGVVQYVAKKSDEADILIDQLLGASEYVKRNSGK